MNFSLKSIGKVLAALTASTLMQMLYVECVRAEVTVVNPSFQIPPVGQAPGGSLPCPQTTPAIGWTFVCPSGVFNDPISSAPNAPPPPQVGYVQNGGSISQTIDLPYSGTYTLSFYVGAWSHSAPANTIEPLLVDVLSHTKPPHTIASGVFTPASASSFSLVKLSITVTGLVSPMLRPSPARFAPI